MTEPRFHTGVTDPDKTTPIAAEALDSLRARDGGGEDDDDPGRGAAGDRSAAERAGAERPGAERAGLERPGVERHGVERGGVERPGAEWGGTGPAGRPGSGQPERPLDGRPFGATAGSEPLNSGRGPDHPAPGRGADRPGFRSGPESRESSFASRYVDSALPTGREQVEHGGNGHPAYPAPAFGATDHGRPSSPGGIPAAGSSHPPPAGHRPGTPTGGSPGAPAGYGGAGTGAGGDAGSGWGGYGASSYAGGYPSGESPSAGATQFTPASAYAPPSTYPPPAGSSRGRVDPSAPTAVIGSAGGAGAGLAGGVGTTGATSGLGTAAGTGPFVGGSTLGSSPTGRTAARGRRGTPPRPARRARLLVRHIDPWSTLKFSLVLAVALFFVWLVAVGVLYGVLDGMGVFDKINGLYDEVSGSTGERIITPGLVLGTATLVGAVNIVLMTALATIGAFVYNICSDLVGGIEITLAERE